MPNPQTFFKVEYIVQFVDFTYEYIISLGEETFQTIYIQEEQNPMSTPYDSDFSFITDIFSI